MVDLFPFRSPLQGEWAFPEALKVISNTRLFSFNWKVRSSLRLHNIANIAIIIFSSWTYFQLRIPLFPISDFCTALKEQVFIERCFTRKTIDVHISQWKIFMAYLWLEEWIMRQVFRSATQFQAICPHKAMIYSYFIKRSIDAFIYVSFSKSVV